LNIGRIEGGGSPNVVPDLAIARINIRISSPEDDSRIKLRLEEIIGDINRHDGIRAKLHGQISSPPKAVDAAAQKLFDHVIACGREMGLSLSCKPSGGTCDGNKLAAAGLPVVDSLGPRGGNLHSPEEYLIVESLPERAKLSALLLMKFATGEIPLS